MFRPSLLYFRRNWSSTDPQHRLVGAVGKAIVELGLALVVSTIILSGLFVLDSLLQEIRLFDLFPINVVLVAGPMAYLGNLFWCEVILDMREVDDQEEREANREEIEGTEHRDREETDQEEKRKEPERAPAS